MDERHIVAIDLGTSKFALTVAKIEGENTHIIYYKETPSEGMRNSRVFNPKQASEALKAAVADAEQELGIKITQVVAGMPKYEVRQETASMTMERNPEECITREEIDSLKDMAMETYPLEHPDKEVLFGAVSQSFSNGEEINLVENDIIGMASGKIEGNFKLFIGRTSSIENINMAFSNLGICVARKYFTPDSTARAVLYDSERDNGVALVDFGAGVTSVAIYSGNIMRHYAAIPFGGTSITRDIKSESSISENLAENIKLAYGACMPDKLQNMSEKVLHIVSNSATPMKQLSVKYLSEIITARTREIIEAVLYEIQRSGMADSLKSGIVVTGGCANMTGCCNLIKEMSGYSVRTGYPRKYFTSTGCDKVFETGAAVSIGMILNGKQEKDLNCLMPVSAAGAAQTTVEVETPGNAMDETPVEPREDGTIFGPAESSASKLQDSGRSYGTKSGEKSAPKPEKKKNKPSWFKQKASELGNLFGDFYERVNDETV